MSHAIVVVPCYNEAKRLDVRRFQQYAQQEPAVDFLLVNDGSRDHTLELLERLHNWQPRRFSFLHLAKNSGKAEAVRQGMRLAIAVQPDYVGFWDADLATPLAEISAMCQLLDARPQVELVIGVRLGLLGRSIERTRVRRLLGRLFAQAASLALDLGVYDTQCGAKMFRVSSYLERLLDEPFLARWIFDVELLARMKSSRRGSHRLPLERVVYEHPVDLWRDVAGSKLRGADFPKSALELARIYWRYLRPGLRAAYPPLPVPSSDESPRRGKPSDGSQHQRAA